MSIRTNTYLPMIIIGVLFFTFGFVTWLNGSLIPFLEIACDLSVAEAYWVTMAFYIAYAVMALPMSMVLKRTGYKNGMTIGLVIMALGSLVFIPAAIYRFYPIFLFGLAVLGTGLTILQTAANPYVVAIGPRETAAVRISIMGILNKVAGVIAPLVFTALILSDMSQFTESSLSSLSVTDKEAALSDLSMRLITPYVIMAIMLACLAVFIKLSPLPPLEIESAATAKTSGISSLLKKRNLVFGVVALFFYVGAEVIAGDSIGIFGKELGVTNFGQLTSYTMAFMMLGYIFGVVFIPKYISQERALLISAVFGIVLSVFIVFSDPNSSSLWKSLLGWTAIPSIPDPVLYVALFGLANALVWPAIWPMALEGLNKDEINTASAFLIMAIAGGAILPVIYGQVAESINDSQNAYLLMIPAYLCIFVYALRGRKVQQVQ